jgi:hypothetical protein
MKIAVIAAYVRENDGDGFGPAQPVEQQRANYPQQLDDIIAAYHGTFDGVAPSSIVAGP